MFYFNIKSIYSTKDYACYYIKKKTLFLISLNLFNKKNKKYLITLKRIYLF